MGKILTALIVDDEEETGLLLKGFLARKDIRSEHSKTLSAGLEKVKEMLPDILFLDNNLPDGMGIEYIEKFRPYVRKIVIISAMSQLSDYSIRAGADLFMDKPISFITIDEFIKNGISI